MRRKHKFDAVYVWLLIAAYLSSVLTAIVLAELIVRYLRGVSLMEVFLGQ
jgi:hypothetical protein